MRDENWLGALEVRVTWHDGIACVASLLDQRAGPGCEAADDKLNLSAHVEAQVCCNLFVAAAASVQLESEISGALYELQLDEVMNVLGGRVIAHFDLASVGREFRGNLVERPAQLRCFSFGQDSCREESRRVRLTGSYFMVEKAPIENNGPLPRFEFGVQRLAKTA